MDETDDHAVSAADREERDGSMATSVPSYTTASNGQGGLTITAPEGAVCGLYPGVPGSKKYFSAIIPENALPATCVSTEDGITTYYYADLEEGLYHCGVSMDGYNAVCQVIHYTAQKAAAGVRMDMKLEKLAGNGYEAGYVMLNTQEFIDAQMASEKDSWGQEYVRLFNTP